MGFFHGEFYGSSQYALRPLRSFTYSINEWPVNDEDERVSTKIWERMTKNREGPYRRLTAHPRLCSARHTLVSFLSPRVLLSVRAGWA